jgi:hypothetical protein
MSQILITENQLEGLKQNLNEAYWLNTVLDVVGIVDPTGIADFANAVSYYKQGDTLFAFLSLISAVPYIGDVVGKTAIGTMKAGSQGTKYLRNAEKAINAGNTELALKNLKMLEKVEGPANTLFKTAQNWTSRVDTVIDRIPNMGGLLTGFKKSLQSWSNLFSSASKRSMGVRRLMVNKTPQEQMKLVQGLEAALKREKFMDPAILGKPNILQRFLFGGGLGFGRFSDLYGKSTLRTRVLMGQTKFYLGFLDKLGFGNFVGPEELSGMMGEEQMLAAMKQYESTPEGQETLKTELGGTTTTQVSPQSLVAVGEKISMSPITSALTRLMSPV